MSDKREQAVSRIMYIESKPNGVNGEARIGRVTFSKSGRTVYYRDRTFRSLSGTGFKANYYDVNTHEEYWISGCKKRGGDRLYSGIVEIDEDVLEEYWAQIRSMPERKGEGIIRCTGKWGGKRGRTRCKSLPK